MTPHQQNSRLLRLATYASVATATLLIVAKLAAWLVTDAVSVLASLIDSLMDVGASVVNLLAVHWSLQPADKDHRFGHGKAEALAGLAQAAFIGGSALFLALHAVDRLVNPAPLSDIGVGIGVMLFAMAATGVLLVFQHRVIRATGSTAIRADALHYATDLATNSATLLALILAVLGWPGLDPLFALGIAVYIFYSAFQIAREAVDLLMDREIEEQHRQRIKALAFTVAGVRGVHGLRTRRSGHIAVIQLHLELDPDISLLEAHAISDRVEDVLHTAWPDADITIHQDPAGLELDQRGD
ncbi:cation diffusion facilitator family transporter [Lamprocystis purpurea]|jgi:ferrous-iron efflux pump FieF|uniref:cation diffusion facilitator family transporter n=1 Tax=Lamprocystis purpurea TaxID=61598 RepID=UPI00037AD80A|nr:cation diffusion facilitator family transporter [Lamprocystis purpurea]MBV5346957.1 cation diffusion facilitator family transporter [bacterium]